MIKNLMLVVLLVLAAGAWFYLDQLGKEEQQIAHQTRLEMVQARAEGQIRTARAETAQAAFKANLKTDLAECMLATEKARADFLVGQLQPARRNSNQFTLTQPVLDQAEISVHAGPAACQMDYEQKLATGA